MQHTIRPFGIFMSEPSATTDLVSRESYAPPALDTTHSPTGGKNLLITTFGNRGFRLGTKYDRFNVNWILAVAFFMDPGGKI